MARTVDAWTEEVARRKLAAFEDSGLSLAAYCRRIGVSEQRLYYWRNRLGSTSAQSPPNAVVPRLVELAVRPVPSASSDHIELAFPSGHVVRVPGSVGLDQVLRSAGLVPRC
jgi:transposase-like protein